MDVQKRKDLAKEIFQFLKDYAKIAADYDPDFDLEESKFSGPDSSMLFSAAHALDIGAKPDKVFSSMESGCYKGWTSESVVQIHDRLVAAINKEAE